MKRTSGITKMIDLSHVIFNGLVTYKGLPAPIICDYLSREQSRSFYEEGTEFQIGKIEMVSNTGTYIDCPFHRFENGKDLSEIPLEQFTDLDAITIKNRHSKLIKRFSQFLIILGRAFYPYVHITGTQMYIFSLRAALNILISYA